MLLEFHGNPANGSAGSEPFLRAYACVFSLSCRGDGPFFGKWAYLFPVFGSLCSVLPAASPRFASLRMPDAAALAARARASTRPDYPYLFLPRTHVHIYKCPACLPWYAAFPIHCIYGGGVFFALEHTRQLVSLDAATRRRLNAKVELLLLLARGNICVWQKKTSRQYQFHFCFYINSRYLKH